MFPASFSDRLLHRFRTSFWAHFGFKTDPRRYSKTKRRFFKNLCFLKAKPYFLRSGPPRGLLKRLKTSSKFDNEISSILAPRTTSEWSQNQSKTISESHSEFDLIFDRLWLRDRQLEGIYFSTFLGTIFG